MHDLSPTRLPLTITYDNKTFNGAICLANLSLEGLQADLAQNDWLHPEEKKTFQAMHFPRRQESYLLGRYCAKHALEVLFPSIPKKAHWIQTGLFQQPMLRASNLMLSPTPGPIEISITHSNAYGAALAFDANLPMGIDLEVPRDHHEDTIRGILSPQEILLLEQKSALFQQHLPNITSYLWIWTAKEALSKAIKIGFVVDMSIYAIQDIALQDTFLTGSFVHFHYFKSISFMWKEAVITVALPKKAVIQLG